MGMLNIGSTQGKAEKSFRILQVVDNVAYARLVVLLLSRSDRYRFEVMQVNSLKLAINASHEHPFDAVLLDLELPDSQGLATLERMCHAAPELPVVLLTSTKQEAISLQAVQYGAQDYLVKGEFDAELLTRAICYAIDRKQAETDLARLAQFDPLTGLANRQLFVDRLEQAIIRAKRNNSLLGLLYMDLDNFKSINDSLGHDFGDLLLEQTAERIQSSVRARDTVARIGGDEFTVILENVADKSAVAGIADKIIESISRHYLLRGHEILTTTSVGAVLLQNTHDLDAKRLIKQADLAMYKAKQHAGNMVLFYDSDMDDDAKTRIRIEVALRNALLREQFELEYQPQVDVSAGKIIGAEALLRWRNPEFADNPIEHIIGVLEQIGLIGVVGEWILDTACSKWETWRRCGYLHQDASISVNLSARQFWQHDLVSIVKQTLKRTGLPARLLDLELTENLLQKNTERNIQSLEALRELGVSITIDDFGTGYCSLAYLKHFPISRIKIDRSFVREIIESEEDRAIASAIIELARNLNMKIIAEGVDSWEKIRLLHARGCRYFQGNQFSLPLTEKQFVERCRGSVDDQVNNILEEMSKIQNVVKDYEA